MELVSVIIPLYNKKKHIARAINSVLNQSFRNFEIVVVDDGSTDGSSDVVESIKDNRIRLVRQQNAGVSAARNSGIKYSQYDLIAFLDADDEWKNGFLETVLRLRKRFPQAGIYSTNYVVVREDGSLSKVKQIGIPNEQWEGEIPYFKSVMLGGRPACSSTVVIPKEVFADVGNFAVGVSHGEDTDMWGRIALKYPIVFCSQIEAIYYKNAENRAQESFKKEKEWIFEERVKEATKGGVIPSNVLGDVKEYIANKKIHLAKLFIVNGMSKDGRRILKDCVTSRFIYRKYWWLFWSWLPYKFVVFSLTKKKSFRRILHKK